MRRILILDTETTGLDHEKDLVIEVAVARYDIEHATVLDSFASLIRTGSGNAAEAVNRIPASSLLDAPFPDEVWSRVEQMASTCDVVAAHRADFDRPFVERALGGPIHKPWMCTKFDTPWPRQNRPGASLVQLALDLDLGVAYAHRAAADVDLIARCLTRAKQLGADLGEMVRMALRPKVRVVALVSYEERSKASSAGFQWDGEKKQWWRVMPAEDAAALPFPTKVAA